MIKHNAYLLLNFLEERTVLSELYIPKPLDFMSFLSHETTFKKASKKWCSFKENHSVRKEIGVSGVTLPTPMPPWDVDKVGSLQWHQPQLRAFPTSVVRFVLDFESMTLNIFRWSYIL